MTDGPGVREWEEAPDGSEGMGQVASRVLADGPLI